MEQRPSDPDGHHAQPQCDGGLDLPDCPDSHDEQRYPRVLTGGALPKNIFWQVAGSVEIGTTAHLEGIILCKTMINLRTGASISGRLMAQSAVTLDSSTIVQPAP